MAAIEAMTATTMATTMAKATAMGMIGVMRLKGFDGGGKDGH